jgi:hypothetical protein
MNSTSRSNRNLLFVALGVALGVLASGPGMMRSIAIAAGLDVEIPFEIKPLRSSVVAPYFLTNDGGVIIVSDQAGGLYSVTMGGKTTPIAPKTKLKNPAGVAVGPAGFGSGAGQYFVLNTEDIKQPCEVDKVDKSGGVTTFAKLPGGATDCRDLEFGADGTPFAGKLYAVTTGNATVYAIDSSGKATPFGVYDKPVKFELTTIGFAPADDPKAPGVMLLGMRPNMGGAAKVGRIGMVGPDGKLKDDVYLVGFIRPSGFAWSPSSFGTYDNVFFIADTGRWVSENNGDRDGAVYRVEKGLARDYATGLMDPTDMKFIGGKMVIADPAEKGKGQGSLVIISSMM